MRETEFQQYLRLHWGMCQDEFERADGRLRQAVYSSFVHWRRGGTGIRPSDIRPPAPRPGLPAHLAGLLRRFLMLEERNVRECWTALAWAALGALCAWTMAVLFLGLGQR